MSELLPFSLRIWEADFGLPTVDPNSLIALTLLKMSNANVRITYGSCPQYAAIPSLTRNNKLLAEGSDFLESTLSVCNLDSHFDGKLQGLSMAYKRYFLETFEPLFFYDCWINKPNYEQFIRPWYMSAITFPFNFLYMKSKRRQVVERYHCIKKMRTRDNFLTQSYEGVSCCLEDFNTLLSDRRSYILGELPSGLDAIVYGYIKIALSLPVPDGRLQNTIKNYKYLCQYVRNLTRRYYPEAEVEYKRVQPETAVNERASTLTLLIAAISASTLMMAYAHINGIIHLKFPKISLSR